MIRVSYAQNYEDVMLARALAGVEHGFYVDVGAQDPVGDSVTKAFYEIGWRGINIEPVEHWYNKLVEDRPHDVNLRVAVSDGPGKLHLVEVLGSGLSTSDPEFARRHADAGLATREFDVECVTLSAILESQGVNEVHFLKIDCEGAEKAALKGLNLQRVRPWIILLEATEPNSQIPAYEDWEPLLTKRGYRFVYADGLNRFYLADEHAELSFAFQYPPNVFDRFVRASESQIHERLRQATSELDDARNIQRLARVEAERDELRRASERAAAQLEKVEEERRSLENKNRAAETRMRKLELELSEERRSSAAEISRLHHEIALRNEGLERLSQHIGHLQRSTSWLITAPLRWLGGGVQMAARVSRKLVYVAARPLARACRPLLRKLAQKPRVRALVVKGLGAESRLLRHARLFLFGVRDAGAMSSESSALGTGGAGAPKVLSEHAHQLKGLLEQAFEASGRDKGVKE